MDWNFLIAAAIVGGVGLVIGIFLCLAEKKLTVETDPREAEVREVLPGANCGSCGYSGCAALAAAIISGEADIDACPVGGTDVATQIGAIMGVSIPEGKEKKVAFVRCKGDCERTFEKYNYSGPKTCAILRSAPATGPKSCTYGCSGYGDCIRACPFGAISIIKGIARVNPDKCRDCLACISACPKGLIVEVPYSAVARVACVNPDKGRPVMTGCGRSCIKCKKCEKVCPSGAIKVTKGAAEVDYSKCTNCGACKEACPRNCII